MLKGIQGHDKLRANFKRLASNGMFPQTCLFYGLESIGKRQVAYDVIAELLCKPAADGQDALFGDAEPTVNNWEDNKAYQMLMDGTHPDFILIRPTAPKSASKSKSESTKVEPHWTIKVEQVQDLKSKLVHYPLMGDYQVVLIDDADKMTKTTANSLLKLLEEPRPNQVFIMISNQLNRVLPTLRSRSAKFYFSPLNKSDVQAIVKEQLEEGVECSSSEFEFFYRCFQGSISPIMDALMTGINLNMLASLASPQKDFGAVSKSVKKILDQSTSLPLLLQCLRQYHLEQVENVSPLEIADVTFFDKIKEAEFQLSRHIQKDFVLENLLM